MIIKLKTFAAITLTTIALTACSNDEVPQEIADTFMNTLFIDELFALRSAAVMWFIIYLLRS